MSLITCKDCGKEYSGLATLCPNCGRPTKTAGVKKMFFMFILPPLILVPLFMYSLFGDWGNLIDDLFPKKEYVVDVVKTSDCGELHDLYNKSRNKYLKLTGGKTYDDYITLQKEGAKTVTYAKNMVDAGCKVNSVQKYWGVVPLKLFTTKLTLDSFKVISSDDCSELAKAKTKTIDFMRALMDNRADRLEQDFYMDNSNFYDRRLYDLKCNPKKNYDNIKFGFNHSLTRVFSRKDSEMERIYMKRIMDYDRAKKAKQ